MRFGMGLDDSRMVVLDIVASAVSGMPVYYSVPKTMAPDPNLLPIATAAPSGPGPLQRLWSAVQTQLTTARA
jgi:hypothetical protein